MKSSSEEVSGWVGNSRPKQCARCKEMKLLREFGHAKVKTYCTACRKILAQESQERYKREHRVPNEKRCPKCAVRKSWEEFSRSRIRSDGLASHCKTCMAEYHQQYYVDNAAAVKVRTHARRSHIVGLKTARESLSGASEWRTIQDEFFHLCAYCGTSSEKLTQEHVIPINTGGSVSWRNVVPACQHCNTSKSDKPLLIWLFTRTVRTEACV
jgi:5-methylcytosine-specific restriction endonuclease McrA